MIIIKCCATCKYFKRDTCMNPDQWDTWKTADDTCDDWKEQTTSSDQQEKEV